MVGIRAFLAGLVAGIVVVGALVWWTGSGPDLPYGSFEGALAADGTELVPANNSTSAAVKVLQPAGPSDLAAGSYEVHLLVYDRSGPAPLTRAVAWAQVCTMADCTRHDADHRAFGVHVAEGVPVERAPATLEALVTLVDGTHLHFRPP